MQNLLTFLYFFFLEKDVEPIVEVKVVIIIASLGVKIFEK